MEWYTHVIIMDCMCYGMQAMHILYNVSEYCCIQSICMLCVAIALP